MKPGAVQDDAQDLGAEARVTEIQERVKTLTPRETEVFALVVTGMLNKQIAAELGIGEKTVTELGSKVLEGAGAGAAISGTVGGILAAVAAVATVGIPGVGLLVAGPLAAALVGAGAGGAAGGIIGALIGAGIPEDRATRYETGLREGGIVMGVTPRSDADAEYLEGEWRRHRGEDIYRNVA